MKNQRMKSATKSFRFSKLVITFVMIATLICCFTLLASAATDVKQLEILPGDVVMEGEWSLKDGVYTKTYDGSTALTLRINREPTAYGIDAADVGKVWVVAEATLGSANAGSQELAVSYKLAYKDAAAETELSGKYVLPHNFTRTVKIEPLQLTWEKGGIVTVDPINYTFATSYDVTFAAPALVGVIAGDDVSVAEQTYTVTVNGVASAADTVSAQKMVALVGAKAANYVINEPVMVMVSFNKIQVTVNWGEYNFVYGDQAVYAITVTGTNTTLGRDWVLKVVYPEGFNGDAGVYEITVATPDAANIEIVYPSGATGKQIKIEKKAVQVSIADATYTGNGKESYTLVVGGDIPADIRNQIEYKYNGVSASGTSAYGVHTVSATLPASQNYSFVDASGKEITAPLTAKLTVKKVYTAAGNEEQPYAMILVGENGFIGDIKATVSTPTLSRRAINGYPYHAAYTLAVTGAAGESFTVYIPIAPELLNKYAEAISGDHLYIYEDLNASMVQANQNGYTVSVEDGYIVVGGLSGDTTVSFVIAPEYNPPFWMTAWGIALIILVILVVIAILTLIGLQRHRADVRAKNEAMTIDTEGDVPEIVPVVVPDKVDEDASLEASADQMAENLSETVEAEADQMPEVDDAEVEAVADEAKDALMEEVAAIDLTEEEASAEETSEEDVAEAIADQVAESLADSVEAEPEAEAEADEDAVRAAVEETIAENLNESADATDAIALVVDAEEADDEMSIEDFKAVVDVMISDVLAETLVLPEAEETEAEAEAEAEATVAETETVVVDEISNEDVCMIIATAIDELLDTLKADGVAVVTVEGTTVESIAALVEKTGAENIPESWNEELAQVVKATITEELAARLLTAEPVAVEEEPAVEAFAVVETTEDDDNDDDNDDDENDGFGGFGSMALTFIDIMEEPEKYQELLDAEARGEVTLVTRYRRSYQSRLAQSQGNVQEYYNILKNALLSYKGVKSRISWNYEAFNKGRSHLAKMNAKTKTLYLYLALDPAELADTKYGITDMSAKKKYASVPVLLKIKGERKFKYALELIAKLCGETMALPEINNYQEVDYRIPYQNTEDLVQAGYLKKLVAAVPVVKADESVAEEEPTETTTAALEDQEMTFIAPTDAPAIVEAAEAVAAEEAEERASEETEVTEVAAEAENTEGETTENE